MLYDRRSAEKDSEIYLELDPIRKVRQFFGAARARLGVLCEASMAHDVESVCTKRICDRLFEELIVRLDDVTPKGLEECRRHIREATWAAIRPDEEMFRRDHGLLTFTVVRRNNGEWSAFNLGPNLVLHISSAKIRRLVEPHSPFVEQVAAGMSFSKAVHLAGVSTVSAAMDRDSGKEIRTCEVGLETGEWILVAPGSGSDLKLQLARQPKTVGDVARVVDVLGEPYAQYTRSWLAVCGGS